MKTNSPPTRRSFRTAWDEIEYLYDKIIYWFYDQGNGRRAMYFADRMQRMLRKTSPEDKQSIFGRECHAVLSELSGDLRTAIKHRKKEIELIRKLHDKVHDTKHEEFALSKYGYDSLSDRLDLLAILQHDAGKVDEAIRTLRESEKVCKKHGLTFDGQDLLNDYLAEHQRYNGTSLLG